MPNIIKSYSWKYHHLVHFPFAHIPKMCFVTCKQCPSIPFGWCSNLQNGFLLAEIFHVSWEYSVIPGPCVKEGAILKQDQFTFLSDMVMNNSVIGVEAPDKTELWDYNAIHPLCFYFVLVRQLSKSGWRWSSKIPWD